MQKDTTNNETEDFFHIRNWLKELILKGIKNFQYYPPTFKLLLKLCSRANLFDTNIRKCYAKKQNFFLPRMLRLGKSLGKINFLQEQN